VLRTGVIFELRGLWLKCHALPGRVGVADGQESRKIQRVADDLLIQAPKSAMTIGSTMKTTHLICASGFLLLAVTGQGAVAPASAQELAAQATHIISGEVLSVSWKTRKSAVETGIGLHRDRVFTIKLKVAAVAKGAGVTTGDTILIQAWQPSTRIPPLPGPQGHVPVPAKGDFITLYSAAKVGQAYKPILPNGMKIQQQ
jgi:hypothetical protein